MRLLFAIRPLGIPLSACPFLPRILDTSAHFISISLAPPPPRYDLKGSVHGRSAKPDKDNHVSVYKDLDLDFSFVLTPMEREVLLSQLKKDLQLLVNANVMVSEGEERKR